MCDCGEVLGETGDAVTDNTPIISPNPAGALKPLVTIVAWVARNQSIAACEEQVDKRERESIMSLIDEESKRGRFYIEYGSLSEPMIYLLQISGYRVQTIPFNGPRYLISWEPPH